MEPEEEEEFTPWFQTTGFEDEDDDEQDRPKRGGHRGDTNALQRLLRLLNKPPTEICQEYLIHLPPDFETAPEHAESRRQLSQRISEHRQYVQVRAEKTSNTYFPIQEQVLAVLRKWYAEGTLLSRYSPSSEPGALQPCFVGEVNGDAVLAILQRLVKGQKISQILAEQPGFSKPSASAAAAAAAAAAAGVPAADADIGDADEDDIAASAANQFNADDYAVGSRVFVLGLPADIDAMEDIDESVELQVLAMAVVVDDTGETFGTVKMFQVKLEAPLDPQQCPRQCVWVDDADNGHEAGVTTLQQVFNSSSKTLLVPVTNLTSVHATDPGPQRDEDRQNASAVVGAVLSVNAVSTMKMKQAKTWCQSIPDIHVTKAGNRKAPFIEALVQWIQDAPDNELAADGSICRTVPAEAVAASEQQTEQQQQQSRSHVVVEISKFLFKNWLNASTNLQKTQRMLLGDNRAFSTIRQSQRMAQYIQTYRRMEAVAAMRSIGDRQAGTIATRPKVTQLRSMSSNWWLAKTLQGLKLVAMFLTQVCVIARGGEIRNPELADMFVHPYAHFRPVPAMAVVTLKQNGKTNQNGQLMYLATLSHKDPALCPVAFQGLYEVLRFSIGLESFPDLTQPAETWYFIPVFPNESTGAKMTYEEHRYNIRQALDAVDITGGHSTHMPRKMVIEILDKGGSHDNCRHHGGWELGDMELSYANCPDPVAMLLMCGFMGMDSHCPWWTVQQPPDSLIDKLFVTASGLTIRQQIELIKERNRDASTRSQTALGTAGWFLHIGIRALQALPFLETHPQFGSHPVMQCAVFNNEEYRSWAKRQRQYVKEVTALWQLQESPTMGPLYTFSSGEGYATVAAATPQERQLLVQNGCITYAANSCAAVSYALGTGMADAQSCFMWVSFGERNQLLIQRKQQLLARTAAAGSSSGSSNPAAAATGDGSGDTAGLQGGHAAAAAGSDAGSAGATGSNTRYAAAAGHSAAAAAGAGPASSVGDGGGATPANGGSADSAAAGGGGSAAQGVAGDPAAGAAAAEAVAGDDKLTMEQQLEKLQAQMELLTGMVMQSSLVQSGSTPMPAADATGNQRSSTRFNSSGRQQQQQGRRRRKQQPSSDQPMQEGESDMFSPAAPATAAAADEGADAAGEAGIEEIRPELHHFALTTGMVASAANVPSMFEVGWPPTKPAGSHDYLPLSSYKWVMEKSQRSQADELLQCYLFIKGVARQFSISRQLAAQVVDAWRSGEDAVVQYMDGQIVSVSTQTTGQQATEKQAADQHDAGSAGSLPNPLVTQTSRKFPLSLAGLCKVCRNLQCVLEQKDSRKSAAGRAGATSAKRQRTAEPQHNVD